MRFQTKLFYIKMIASSRASTILSFKKKILTVPTLAIDAQAFGAPTYIIREDGKDDLMFFGQGMCDVLYRSRCRNNGRVRQTKTYFQSIIPWGLNFLKKTIE